MSEWKDVHNMLDSFFQLTQWSQEHEGGEANEEWDRGFQAAMALVKSHAPDTTDPKPPKEPNGSLVMTTCKCRENSTNLVMTRTWFEEQLQSKIELGSKQEHERVIGLVENELSCTCGTPFSHLLDLIKGIDS
jgi:hypothetical protein